MVGSGYSELTTLTIPELFARQAAAKGDSTLFLVKRDGSYHPITWRQAASDVWALSAFLLTQEVAPGDRVILFSPNRPEWGMADLAILSTGAWTVPLYPKLAEADVLTICRDCQPVVAIAASVEQAAMLLNVRASVPSLRVVVILDGGQTPKGSDPLSWTAALAKGREAAPALAERLEKRRAQITPSDTATLLYTSGTTGEPKGVMLSHRNLLSNVAASLEVIPITERDVHLSFLPLSHVFERMAGWYLMLVVGARVAYAESLETVPQNMLEVRPTVMLAVPRFFEKLKARIEEALAQAHGLKRAIASWALDVGKRHAARRLANQPLPAWLALQRRVAERLVFRKMAARLGGRLRFIVSGSAPLSQEIGEFFFSLGIVILEGYGLTETSPVIAANRLPTPRFGSVGLPIPGVEVRIAEDGEILTRGPHVMQGYYGKPEATASAMVNGWFHTGDIGHLDQQGCLVITDRKKDLIKTAGGKFVAPQKLEQLFTSDPAVAQAFVYGDKRPYCVALLVPRQDALLRYAKTQGIQGDSLTTLVRDPRVVSFFWDRVQALQQPLANFEQVKRIALLEQEFSESAGELTPTLKVKRRVVAERYRELLEQLYQT